MTKGNYEQASAQWQKLPRTWSVEQAEHALVPGFELTAFVIAADPAKGWKREIAWEIHGGPHKLELIATAHAATFEDAKARAETAWRELVACRPG